METIKKGSKNIRAVILCQAMLKEAGYRLGVDGKFGSGTEQVVKDYQLRKGLVSDGVVGAKTWTTLFSQFPDLLKRMTSKFLGEEDIVNLAENLGVETAVIKAVNEVESSGIGFIVDKPKILFEGHIFWGRLKKHGLDPIDHIRGNEDILHAKWNSSNYRGGLAEFDRLERAKQIHEEAALESASWGLFQIMGYHYHSLNYPTIQEFVDRMHQHERDHLEAFGRFVESNNLVRHLKNLDWAKFAKAYNGPGYKKNRYDIKLANAYVRYAS